MPSNSRNTIIETQRLIIREVDEADENDLFEMDADPAVHRYINQSPVTSMEQVRAAIEFLQDQYKVNGVGRWAVVDKITRECLGWAGLKYFTDTVNGYTNFYEYGYRFKQKHWGKGYATEASRAILDYGFTHLHLEETFALTDIDNTKSKHVLMKLRFEHHGAFDFDGRPADWFALKKKNWKV